MLYCLCVIGFAAKLMRPTRKAHRSLPLLHRCLLVAKRHMEFGRLRVKAAQHLLIRSFFAHLFLCGAWGSLAGARGES